MPDDLRALRGGSGSPGRPLLLLHGLGATAEVWRPLVPVLEQTWPGRWVAPDLPGHGGSGALPRYSFGALAAAVATVIEPDERPVVLGHSLGGVVGLALASGWFGVPVSGVVGLGIKVAWTDEELARARALATRPVSWFDDRESAVRRALLVAGLAGLVAPDDPSAAALVHERDGRWRLALDPAAFAVGAPDMPGLLSAVRAPVVLARGEGDEMVTTEQLDWLLRGSVVLPGAGHNAHVEQPAAVAALLDRCTSRWGGAADGTTAPGLPAGGCADVR